MNENENNVTPATERTFTAAEAEAIAAEAIKRSAEIASAAQKAQIDAQFAEMQAKMSADMEAFKTTAREEAKEEVRRNINPFNIGGKAVEDKADDLVVIGRIVRSHAVSRMEGRAPIDVARSWSKERPTSSDAAVLRIMETQTNTSGGFIKFPAEIFDGIVPLLEAEAVVRSMGPTTLTVPSGRLVFNKETGAATASYVGEAANITATDASFGNIELNAKKLAALVAITNDLIRNSAPNIDRYMAQRLITAHALREDLALIRGDGTSNTPKGFKNLIASGNQFAQAGTTLANVTSDLDKAVEKVESANVKIVKGGWLFTPRVKKYLKSLRDGNGNYAFRDEIMDGMLNGYPYRVTTQIPNTLGGGTESEVYFVDFDKAILMDTGLFEVTVSENAAYHNGSTVVSGLSQDTSVIRSLSEHDFNMLYDTAGAVITGVTWGA